MPQAFSNRCGQHTVHGSQKIGFDSLFKSLLPIRSVRFRQELAPPLKISPSERMQIDPRIAQPICAPSHYRVESTCFPRQIKASFEIRDKPCSVHRIIEQITSRDGTAETSANLLSKVGAA